MIDWKNWKTDLQVAAVGFVMSLMVSSSLRPYHPSMLDLIVADIPAAMLGQWVFVFVMRTINRRAG